MLDYKQKAKSILIDFYSIVSGIELNYLSKLMELSNGDSHYKTAKECAKIHVKGIIEALPSSSKKTFKGDSKVSIYDYWQQVLTEIENL